MVCGRAETDVALYNGLARCIAAPIESVILQMPI